MRDVNNGWLLRYFHSNTASAFFFLVSLSIIITCFYLCVIFIISTVDLIKKILRGTGLLKLISRGKGNKRSYVSNPKTPLNSLSDEDFYEWFRGFVDAEGCFLIVPIGNYFKLVFTLCLHKDETPLLKYITQRLGVGNLSVKKEAVSYTISRKDDLLKIFRIFDKRPLNTSKNLNYVMFRQAYDLYFNRESIKVSMELRKIMIDLKNQINKKRIDFNHNLIKSKVTGINKNIYKDDMALPFKLQILLILLT